MARTPRVLWEPSEAFVQQTRVRAFQRWLTANHGVEVSGYDELWRWSVGDLEGFWSSVAEYFEVRFHTEPSGVLERCEMPGAQWFAGATLSYPEHIFRDRDESKVAIRHASELRPLQELTWGGLREQTARIQAGLRALGVGRGDRVAAYMPNVAETVAAFLATAGLGAVWSSCSPDFGARSVIDRFAQIEPTVLFAVDGYRYGGRDHDRSDVVSEIHGHVGGTLVRLGYLDGGGWEAGFLGAAGESELVLEPVAFDHPLWVLYSSGTTGLPKAIVQGHGGILLEQLKHQNLHLDMHQDDRAFWFTTTGWMMWNFLVGVLLTPASIVLYDGNPAMPSLDRLWNLAEEAGITCFGTSAAFIAGCMKGGVQPRGPAGDGAGRDLSALRSVGSTGSPLSPEGFRWIYGELGDDTWLFSTSGGTDVCTAFVGGVPLLPVYEGELQARSLGCDVQSFGPDGSSLVDAVGELVVTQPMPSMPTGFWNDPGGERLREAYFDLYPGVWRHGDWIEITSRGTAVIHGRSDATVNRGGVRMGTSEIYAAVLALEEIVDALVVDVDGWMALFVVPRPGAELDDALRAALARRIRADCSPRHVPDDVFAVAEVPRTLSGKLLEVPVKRILAGADPARVASRDSLANPAALDWFAAFARERGERRMSRSRAKKKQRRRAREAAGAPAGAPAQQTKTGTGAADPTAPRTRTRHPSRLEIRDGVPRPDAIWAPFPLTEIGMGVGLVLFLIGFAGAPALLLAGVGVLVVVVAELCLREHLAGFRSHSILLAMLPVTTVHLGVVVLGDVTWRGPLALAVDLAIAGGLAWWLRGRFAAAQGRARLRAT